MAFELPEAVTVSRQMDETLRGLSVERVQISPLCDSLIRQGFVNLRQVSLEGRAVLGVDGRGKWIFTHLQPNLVFLIALESGGQVRYFQPGENLPEKFHLRLDFDGGGSLVAKVVGWGFLKALPEDQVELENYPGRLGISPIDQTAFTANFFNRLLDENPGKLLKVLLTHQWTIAGIGSGYFQEILYRAGIHPARKAGDLSSDERQRLFATIPAVLNEAVRLGGSSREVDLFGCAGGYPKTLGAESLGQPCPACGTPFERLKISGAQLYFCPGCQKA